MAKKLIIFDLDGTLINTLSDLNIAVNYALAKYNYPPRTLLETRRDIGNGVAKLIERSIPDGINNKNYPECLEIFRSYYRVHYFENSFPYEGIKETLDTLKSMGYTLAVVSNKFNEGANKMVTRFFPGVFAVIKGEGDGYRTKPAPDMVDFVLKETGFARENAIYVGDTNVDLETAKNAQIPAILVSYGYRDKDFLLNLKGAPVVDAPSDIIKELLK